jgi:hypothetical protein
MVPGPDTGDAPVPRPAAAAARPSDGHRGRASETGIGDGHRKKIWKKSSSRAPGVPIPRAIVRIDSEVPMLEQIVFVWFLFTVGALILGAMYAADKRHPAHRVVAQENAATVSSAGVPAG